MAVGSDSGEMWRAIDLICDAFESARKSGTPNLDEYLTSIPEAWQSHLKLELEAIDRSYATLDSNSEPETRLPDDSGSSHEFTSSESAISAGQLWRNRFEIKERLGFGAAGTVWLAYDQRLSRKVALKLSHEDLPGDQNELRIANEAKAIAAMSHPGIVQIHEVISEKDATVLVEQYVEGQPLSQKINDGSSLAFGTIVPWAIQIAAALAHAHEHGVIHRDLKPGNIMIQRDRPVILDFGMASCRDGLARLTAAGTILGTPAYMSPEQAIGKPTGSEFATDIYSFGAILYELLTGAPPFRGTVMEILKSVRYEHPVPPRRIRSSIPRDLETITMRCLSKSPGSRYASAADLRDDLERFQKRQPIQAREVSRLELGWFWCRQRPVQTLLLILLPVILGLSSGWLASSRERAELSKRSAALLDKQKLNEQRSQQLEKEMAFVQLSRASQEFRRGDQKRGTVFLNEIPQSQRNWVWHLLSALSQDKSEQLSHESFEPNTFTISAIDHDANSGMLFSGSNAGTIVQWSPNSDQSTGKQDTTDLPSFTPTEISRETSSILDLQTSNDGRWLAWSTREGNVVLHEISSGEEKFRWVFEYDVPVKSICFSPNGNQLIMAGGGSPLLSVPDNARRSWIKLASLRHSNLGEILDENFGTAAEQFAAVTFGSPGNILVAAGSRGHDVAQRSGSVTRFDVSDDQLSDRETIWQGQSLADIDYSATAKLSTWCDSAGLVHIFDSENDRVFGQLNVSQEPLHCVEFSQDGKKLVVGGQDGVIRSWDVSTGTMIRKYQGHRQPVLDVAQNVSSKSTSPNDGQVISCGSDGKIRVWHSDERFGEVSIKLPCDSIANARWSEDGNTILVSTKGNVEDNGLKNENATDLDGSFQIRQHRLDKSGIDVKQFSSPNMRTSPIGAAGDYVSCCTKDRMFLLEEFDQSRTQAFNLSPSSGFSFGITGRKFAVSFLKPPKEDKSRTLLTKPNDVLLSLHDFSSGRSAVNKSVPGVGLPKLAKLSPDEKYLAVCCHVSSRISIVRVDPENEERPFDRIYNWRPHDWYVSDLAWSQDGKYLATCSGNGTVAWWKHSFGNSKPSAELIHLFQASNRELTSVSISPDQQYLATCGEDRSIRLWSLENGCELLSFAPQPTSVTTVQFSPDGDYLLIALSNGRLKVLPLRLKERSTTAKLGVQ